MLDFIKFMLDGSLSKLIVFIFIISCFTSIMECIFKSIPEIIKAFKKNNNNFFISEKNVDKKFLEELKNTRKANSLK